MLGFLAFGTLIGPYGLASYAPQWPWLSWLTFARPEDVEFLAELGVICGSAGQPHCPYLIAAAALLAGGSLTLIRSRRRARTAPVRAR